MPFAYYDDLSPGDKKTYERSDAIGTVLVPRPGELTETTAKLATALRSGDRAATEAASRALTGAILEQLAVAPVEVKVLARRPSDDWGELQGLYELDDGGQQPVITVWMRTARRKQVVAFRTYLRTLLHEIVHHLDYERYELEQSFHTQGFYRRESSLFHQLVADLPDELKARATQRKPRRALEAAGANAGAAGVPGAAGVDGAASEDEAEEALPRPIQGRML